MFGGPTWSRGHSSLFSKPTGPADLILTPGYGVKTTPHKLVAKWRARSRLVVWHGEQIYGPWAYDIKLNLKRMDDYLRHVDAHLVWGPQMASLLRSRCNVPAENIYVVGCPKLDVLRPPLWERVPPEERTILFVSDFGLGDLSAEEYDRVAAIQRWGDHMRAKCELYKRARERFVAAVALVARAAPNEHIVVRIHPGERLEPYRVLEAHSNVTLDPAKRNFPQALAEAKVVLQFTSTSLFETRVAGIPVYSIDLIDWRGDELHEWYFPWISESQLTENLDEILAGTLNVTTVRPIEDALTAFFSYDDGPSLPRTLAAISRVCDQENDFRLQPSDAMIIARYLVRHKAKELLARAAVKFSHLGLATRMTRRVVEAQRRYEDGPNFIRSNEVIEHVASLSDSDREYLDGILSASRRAQHRLTDFGVVVTCQA